MTGSTLSAIIASVALVLLILGFLIGWARGYQKSILALIVTLGCAVIAFFVTPLISKAILDISYKTTVNGEAVNTLGEYVVALIKSIEAVREMLEASPTMADLITAMPQLLANIVLFLVAFILLKFVLWLIVYLPISLTVFGKKRLEGKSKVKLLGGGIGVVSALAIIAVLLVPVFGLVSITSQMSQENEEASTASNQSTYEVVLASSTSSGGGSSMNIDTIVDEVTKYTEAFNNTWIIKLYNGIGVGKLSVNVFDKLTTTEVNGVTASLTGELRTISKVVPIAQQFANDLTINEDFVKNLRKLTDSALESDVLSNITSEIISSASSKWANGEKFMKMDMPKVGDNVAIENLMKKTFQTLSSTNATNLREDVNSMVSVLEDLVNTGLIDELTANDVDGDKIISVISDNNKKVIAKLVTDLASSEHLRAIMPDVINVGLDYIYQAIDVVVPTNTVDNPDADKYYWVLANASTDWAANANKLQEMVGGIGRIYTNYQTDYVKYNEGRPESEKREIIDAINFGDFGMVIDKLRASSLFSDSSHANDGPGKNIYSGLLNYGDIKNVMNLEIDAEHTTIADKLLAQYESTSATAVYDSFSKINDLMKVAVSLGNAVNNLDVSNLDKGQIEELLEAVTASDNILSEIINEDTLKELGVSEEIAGDVQSIIDGIASTTLTDEEKAAEISGVAAVLDIAVQAQGEENITIEDTDALISDIAASETITDLLTAADSTIAEIDVSDKIDEETSESLKQSIESSTELTPEQKSALAGIFGITLG